MKKKNKEGRSSIITNEHWIFGMEQTKLVRYSICALSAGGWRTFQWGGDQASWHSVITHCSTDGA